MSSKTATEVIIGGKVYTLCGYESEEYLQKVASYINNKMNEYSKVDSFRRQSLDTQNVLLQLNIADDYFKAKKQISLLEDELQAKEKELYDLKHELIDRFDRNVADQSKIDSKSNRGKTLKRWLRFHFAAVPNHSEALRDTVFQAFTIFREKEFASFFFVSDDGADHILNLLNEFLFRYSEGHLIADLVEIAPSLRAFSIETTDGKRDFLEAVMDFRELSGESQCRKVKHYAHAHSGSDVGWTCRQVSQLPIPGVDCVFLNLIIQLIDFTPDLRKAKTAFDALHSEMILFNEHQAELSVRGNHGTSQSFRVCQFPADQVALDKEFTVQAA